MSSERDRESDGMKRRECECVISINRFGLFSKYFLFLITSINDPSVFFFFFVLKRFLSMKYSQTLLIRMIGLKSS